MCDSDKELKLGNYAAAFNLSTSSITSDMEDAELAAAVEKLKKELLRLYAYLKMK